MRGQEGARETNGGDAGPIRSQPAYQGAPSSHAKVLGLILCHCPTVSILSGQKGCLPKVVPRTVPVALGKVLSCRHGWPDGAPDGGRTQGVRPRHRHRQEQLDERAGGETSGLGVPEQ